jgi:uncharacterized protein
MPETQVNGQLNVAEPLFDAVKSGSVREVKELLAKGVSPDSRDTMGRTPLMIALEAKDVEIAQTLIDHGADVNAADVDGEPALMAATYSDCLEGVKLLVLKGADLNIRNNEGYTALEIAQEMEANAVMTFLAAQSATSATRVKSETSADHDDDEPPTGGPAAASAAVMPESSESGAYVQELDLELIPEPIRSTYFGTLKEAETEKADSEGKADVSPEAYESDFAADAPGTDLEEERASNKVTRADDDPSGMKTGGSPAIPAHILAENEERIVFDASDNKLVRSTNETGHRLVQKAGMEFGDFGIDTVFKGNHMAVLKPRSQEYKRFRKLWKHPDLLIDPRRWREWIGAAAVRRYCLGEGTDVSPLTGSHFIELYYVKDLKLILTLAEDASTHNYSLRQLKRAIENLREARDDLDPGKVIIKTLDQSIPLLEDPDLLELCTDKDRVLEELSKAERKKIKLLIKARKSVVDEWKTVMDRFYGILSDLED